MDQVERIVQAALAQFADVGIRRTSIEDVARRAGLSRTTVYRLVGGKPELVQLAMRAEAVRAAQLFDEVTADESDIGTQLERGFALLVTFVHDHPCSTGCSAWSPSTSSRH